MKWLLYILGGVVALAVLFVVVMYGASELGGEVVTLERKAADGSTSEVRLWIVDSQQNTWLEHGAPDAEWMALLAEDPRINVERNGVVREYLAQVDPGAHAEYHALRQAKYGFADQLVAIAGGGAEDCIGIPVRIQLVP